MRFILIFLCLFALNAQAEIVKRLSPKQIELLKIAHKEWSKIGWPETGQAMLLQESSAGVYDIGDLDQPPKLRSYGVMQVKLKTARHVLRGSPDLHIRYFGYVSEPPSDVLLITMLQQNDTFNIQIAARYFDMIHDRVGKWTIAVGSYNAGIRGWKNLKEDNKYKHVRRISKRIKKEVRPFNRAVGLKIIPKSTSKPMLELVQR